MSLDKMTIVKRYAKALFELVVEQDQLDATLEELTQLREVFKANDGLTSVLTGAELSLQEKQSLIQALTHGASPYVTNLIQMVFDYGRMNEMVAIIDEFERRYDSKIGRVHAEVVSAVELDDSQTEKLTSQLASRVHAKEVVVSKRIDDSIIGGVIVRTDKEILDGSISSRIEKVRRLLLK